MIGDAPAHGNANGGDFFVFNPYPCPGMTPGGRDAECLKCLDERRFEITKVGVNLSSKSGFEVHQGIDHQLAGTVIGDVSSPAG